MSFGQPPRSHAVRTDYVAQIPLVLTYLGESRKEGGSEQITIQLRRKLIVGKLTKLGSMRSCPLQSSAFLRYPLLNQLGRAEDRIRARSDSASVRCSPSSQEEHPREEATIFEWGKDHTVHLSIPVTIRFGKSNKSVNTIIQSG
jgi:hypothetical protein